MEHISQFGKNEYQRLGSLIDSLPRANGGYDKNWAYFRYHRIESDGPTSIASLIPEEISVRGHRFVRVINTLGRNGITNLDQLADTNLKHLALESKGFGKIILETAEILKAVAKVEIERSTHKNDLDKA